MLTQCKLSYWLDDTPLDINYDPYCRHMPFQLFHAQMTAKDELRFLSNFPFVVIEGDSKPLLQNNSKVGV